MSRKYIIGIDEVGRGCLAGPVVVAALAIPLNFKVENKKPILRQGFGGQAKIKLKDSKKLTAIQREEWFKHIKTEPRILYCIARVSPKVIDRINISAAANRAAHRVVLRLLELSSDESSHGKGCQMHRIYLDGGLFIKNKKYQEASHPLAKTVVKADEKFDAVKLASIVAKVTRDRYMKRLHKRYPDYQFAIHKGYGTKIHRAAIARHGATDAHRISFLRKI